MRAGRPSSARTASAAAAPPTGPAWHPPGMKAWIPRRGRWRGWKPSLAGVLAVVLAWHAIGWLPMPDGLDDAAAARTSVDWTDRHGHTLRTGPATDGAWRMALAEQDVPECVVACTLAAEDARFLRHPGVDPLATLRAAWQWARHRRVVSGASTITQQRVKLGHPRPRTLRTKVIEAALALRLERAWDKPRILRSYLSRIDYGNQAEGLAAAARHYFGKAPRDLSWAEAALLAGLPQAPSRLNPRRHPGARRPARNGSSAVASPWAGLTPRPPGGHARSPFVSRPRTGRGTRPTSSRSPAHGRVPARRAPSPRRSTSASSRPARPSCGSTSRR